MRLLRYAVVMAGIAAAAPVALAADLTVITSATDTRFFHVHATVDYLFSSTSASIVRETAMNSVADKPINRLKDLTYSASRHTLTPRLAFGFFHDIELHVALPIVLADSRSLSFDATDRATSPSTMPEGGAAVGILPMAGFDANNDGANTTGKTAFVGPDRSGLDTVNLGVRWAALNQRRDPSKPTWVVGAEYRLSIGTPMRFDRTKPGDNKGVGRGLNEIYLDTSISRRIGWADPFVHFWWKYASRAGSTFEVRAANPAKGGNNFPVFPLSIGQEDKEAQQMAGTDFGFEAVVWEEKEHKRRIGIEASTSIQATFQGRGYSELWEMLASSPALQISPDPKMTGMNLVNHPGTTVIENYATFGGGLAVRGEMSELIQFRLGGGFQYDAGHAVTFDDAGKDQPNTALTGDTDTVVTPDTIEVNPLHFRTIDLPGKRYRVDSSLTWKFFMTVRFMY